MPTEQPSSAAGRGGIHVGDVGGNVDFHALGDIVGGDKIVNISTTIQIAVEAITQRPLLNVSPYRGLDHFDDRDKDLFFGRDQLIKGLLAQLGRSNVLLVLGPSGSGKSSVVRAGLLPAAARLLGGSFRSFTLVPDLNPFESLRASLQRDFSQSDTRPIADAPPGAVPKFIRSLQRAGEQWLLFVDQFEELFTRSDERLRPGFIEALVGLVQDTSGSIKLALAMRADFLDRLSAYPRFAALVEKNIALVADMHADELRLAIEQPAAQHGIVFEAGLVEEIIKDVQGQAGSLPLLQYTLDLLWEAERRNDGLADRHLNTRAYRELGGVRGALQKRADEIYAALGDGTDSKRPGPNQELVRQIFLRLVDIAGTGSHEALWRPVRRRVAMADFGRSEEQELLRTLINQKLLVSSREGGEATVEVAHEALFASWQRLRNWIEGGKQVIFVRNRLADDCRRWQRRRQEESAGTEEELLAGSRLGQALEMQARGDFNAITGGLEEIEAQFLAASQAQRDRRQQEERERQQRELVQAQVLAAEQKQRADEQARAAARQRRLTLGTVLISIVAVLAAVYARKQQSRTQEANRLASRQLADANWLVAKQARGPGFADSTASPVKATHYLLRAAAALESTGATALMRDAVLAAKLAGAPVLMTLLPAGVAETRGAIFSPDGHTILTWGEDKIARLWSSGVQPLGAPMQHSEPVGGASFSPDGSRVLTWSGPPSEDGNHEVRLWRAADGLPLCAPLKQPAEKRSGIRGAAFSTDGQHFAAWGANGGARLWRSTDGHYVDSLQHGQETRGAESQMEAVAGAGFAMDWLVTWSKEPREGDPGHARVWRLEGGKIKAMPAKIPGPILGLGRAYETGDRLLTYTIEKKYPSGEVGECTLLQRSTDGTILGKPIQIRGPFAGAILNPDVERIVSWTRDGALSLWRANTGELLGRPFETENEISGVSFSFYGDRILVRMAARHYQGRAEVRMWNVVNGHALAGIITHEDTIRTASFSPNGDRVLTCSDDGSVRVWAVDGGQSIKESRYLDPHNRYVEFSAGGKRLLRGTSGFTVELIDTMRGPNLAVSDNLADSIPQEDAGFQPFFSPDGNRALVWKGKNEIQLWDALRRLPVGKPMRMDSWTLEASFDPDSRRIVTWTPEGMIRLWDAADGTPLGPPMKLDAQFVRLLLSRDGKQLFTLDTLDNSSVQFWRVTKDAIEAAGKKMEADGSNEALFSPDGRYVVAWNSLGTLTIRTWDQKIVGRPVRHGRSLGGVAFNANAERFLTWASDGLVKAWWTQSQGPIGQPLQHTAGVKGATFSADGRRVLSWSNDGIAWLWSCDTSQCIGIFQQEEGVASACFDAGETRVLTANFKGEVKPWDISVNDTVSLDERILEFEVRSATTLGPDGQVRVLRPTEWSERKSRLAALQKKRGGTPALSRLSEST